MRNQISMVAGKGIYPLAPTAGDPSPESPGLAMAAGKRICFDASVVRGLGLRSPTEGDCNLHKLVGAQARAPPFVAARRLRRHPFCRPRSQGCNGRGRDSAARPGCSRGGAATPTASPPRGLEPLTAARCPITSAATRKHGVHAHAPHTTTSLRDALTVPATPSHTNETPQPFQEDQDRVAAALARHTSKKKGPAHVPHAGDWFCT